MRRSLRLALLGALVACDRSSGSSAPPGESALAATDSSAGTPLTPLATSSATSSRIASSRPSATAQSWHGAYTSTAATLTVPPDWKKVHWSDTQSTVGIGDGTMALSLDGATGHLSGRVDGPLGPATVEGVVADGTVAATLRRKDPSDQGFTGTLLGSITGDRLEGTLSVSLGLASALRTATFRLSPGDSPGAAP